MGVVEIKKELASKLTKDNLNKNRTTLVIGYAAKLVKQMLMGGYYTLTCADDVRNFIAKFSIESDQLVIFEDLALLDFRTQAFLLKFIEESYCPLLILSSKDTILPTIISRCRTIIKVPVQNKYGNVPLQKFIEDREATFLEDEVVPSDIVEDSLSLCPEYYYLVKRYLDDKSVKQFNKYLKLL